MASLEGSAVKHHQSDASATRSLWKLTCQVQGARAECRIFLKPSIQKALHILDGRAVVKAVVRSLQAVGEASTTRAVQVQNAGDSVPGIFIFRQLDGGRHQVAAVGVHRIECEWPVYICAAKQNGIMPAWMSACQHTSTPGTNQVLAAALWQALRQARVVQL